MGVAEELEALRKQGVTSKNASELQDAAGLSTPEAEADAIRAEQEKNRIGNYGKEASNYLKATSYDKQLLSPSNSSEMDKAAVASANTNTNTNTAQSKDISDMIQITNEIAFVGEGTPVDESGEGARNPVDCLLQGCPFDSSVVENAATSVRGAIDEHVLPRVGEATRSVQGALETAAPRLSEATQSLKGAMDEHVLPNIEKARVQSLQTMENLQQNSMRTLGELQTNSQGAVEAVQKHSQVLLESSKSALDDVSAQTTVFVNETVKPGVETLVATSQTAIAATSEGLQTHAPVYTGTAPSWTSFTTTTTDDESLPWYWLLEESSLRAFGKVVFCDNPVTGIFVWLGILCASPLAALSGLVAVLSANGTAIYLDMDPATVKSGQYGLNAALVGTALVGAFDLDFPETGNLESAVPVLLFLSFALAPSTVLVESLWTKKAPSSIPSLLLPFNSVLLATTVGASVWNRAMETQVVFLSPVAGMDVYDEEPSDFKILHASLNGLLRIFSVDGNIFGGILVLIGVSLCSRIVAASLFAGSFVATVVLGYVIFEENSWYLNSGYAGFTPALVCAGIFYYLVPSWKLTGLAFFGVVNAVILQGAVDVVLGLLGAPVSTSFAFCFTLLPLLSMGFPTILGSEDYFIRTVPESELSTPEDYLTAIFETSPDVPTDSSEEPTPITEDPEAPLATEETPLL